MFQKVNAHILILLFIALFSYESIEFFMGKSFEHQETISGILELEEESGTSEESKEEKDEEIKFEDNFFTDSNFTIYMMASRQSFREYLHLFEASDYSSQIYSPPEQI